MYYCLRINLRKQMHKSHRINILNYIAKFISPQIIPVYFPSRGKWMKVSITLNSLSEIIFFSPNERGNISLYFFNIFNLKLILRLLMFLDFLFFFFLGVEEIHEFLIHLWSKEYLLSPNNSPLFLSNRRDNF